MTKMNNKKTLLFRIKRFNSTYKINTIGFIKIAYYRLILYLKRIKRRLIILTKFLKNIIPTVGLIIIYLVLIYIIGRNNNYSFFDCFWDAKELIYTSIVLAIFIPYYNFMNKRKKDLQRQMNDYLYIYSLLTNIMIDFNSLIGVDTYNNMLWNSEKNEEYCKKVLNNKKSGLINYDNYIISELREQCQDMQDAIKTIINALNKNEYIYNYSDSLLDYKKFLLSISKKYEKCVYRIKEETTKDRLIEYMNDFNYSFFKILVDIRKPWRWDQSIDKKIDLIISNNGRCISEYDSVNFRLNVK